MTLSKRKLQQLINLTGIKPIGYVVRTNGFDGMTDLDVPSTRVGNAIVRALRDLAAKLPADTFPPSALDAVASPTERRKGHAQGVFDFHDDVPDGVLAAMGDDTDLPDCVAAAWR